MQAVSKGRNPIVLTKRLEHLELLEKLFTKAFDRVVVLRGGMGKYIHPFIDGNGRTARLLMNLILMRNGYPISVIRTEDRDRYMKALEEASTEGNLKDLTKIISEAVDRSLDMYLYLLYN